jgi:hypothetical protein
VKKTMMALTALTALAASLWLGAGSSLAADADTTQVPNLVGTWSGPFKVLRENGIAEGTLTLRVTKQDGPLFNAEKTWNTPGAEGYVGDKAVDKATEPLVGVIDFDGAGVHLAEQGDAGLYMGRLAAPDTLELVYIEAGHGTAYRVQLTRQK